MNIAIRVDASQQIGTGHFMRCLTLADALSQRGTQIRFISSHLPEYLQAILLEKGYEFRMLENPANGNIDDLAHSHWLGTTQRSNAEEALQLLSDRTWEWLVVDHYALDALWESILRQTVKNILVIDDIADREHDCDILLDQNFYADMDMRYSGKVPEHCRLLLGPRYALLRDEFRQLHQQVKPRSGPVKRILVFFGGVDIDNYTGRAIDALVALDMHGLHVDVVIGAQHPYREKIQATCTEHGFTCYVQTNRMAELMAAADLAIGAGGSATWERCCLGLSTFALSLADNQARQLEDSAVEGLLYALDINGECHDLFKRHVCALMENSALRRLISHNAMRAVDGRGVFRVIRAMGFAGIDARLASEDDSTKLFEWRNHSTVRAVSRNTELISWNDHQQWFADVLSSPLKVLLIGYILEVPVGVVRFDIKDDTAEVSIYLVSGSNEAGRGQDLLESAERWLKTHKPEIRKLFACVLGSNDRSHHLFKGADYTIESTTYSKLLSAYD